MKLKTKTDLTYIDPPTVEFFQNNGTSSISVMLLTNEQKDGQKDGQTDGQTNGRKFNTSLAEVIRRHSLILQNYKITNQRIISVCLKRQFNLALLRFVILKVHSA